MCPQTESRPTRAAWTPGPVPARRSGFGSLARMPGWRCREGQKYQQRRAHAPAPGGQIPPCQHRPNPIRGPAGLCGTARDRSNKPFGRS